MGLNDDDSNATTGKRPLQLDERSGELRLAELSTNGGGDGGSGPWLRWIAPIVVCMTIAAACVYTEQHPSEPATAPVMTKPVVPAVEPVPSTKPSPAPSTTTSSDADTYVLVGRVMRVTDGDTVHVMLDSGEMDVRMYSIDTPEYSQPWGLQAKAALMRRLKEGTEVSLEPISQDQYDRLVAVVYLNDENINAWMVQQGYAWAYRQYMKDAQYCRWEQQARAQGLGVWSLPSTQRIAPWEYRHAEREHREIVTGETVETESGCISAMRKRSSEATKHVPHDGAVPIPSIGQTEPSAGCKIKGNISESGRIYHVPGSRSYDKTRITPSKGERWFCTEEDARKAGWREPIG